MCRATGIFILHYLHYLNYLHTIYTSPIDLTLYLGVHRFAFYGVSETAIKVEIRGSSTYGFIDDLKQMIFCLRLVCLRSLSTPAGAAPPASTPAQTWPCSPWTQRWTRAAVDSHVTRVPGRLQRHGAAGVSARHPRPQLRGRGGRGHGLGQAGHRGLPPAAHGGQGEVLISTHYLQYLHTIYTGQGGGHLQPGVQGHLARGPRVS